MPPASEKKTTRKIILHHFGPMVVGVVAGFVFTPLAAAAEFVSVYVYVTKCQGPRTRDCVPAPGQR